MDSVHGDTVTVQVTGNLLGTISEDGQYQAAEQGTVPGPWNLTVVRVNGQWRIVNPPDELLFSKRDVNWTFRSRDLYFFDPSLSVLVPDPVYVPAEATSQQLVAHLVEALRLGPDGWLAGATKTAFPPGTVRLGTSVTGNTATVNLGGQARATGAQQRERMAFQLLQTLASARRTSSPMGPQFSRSCSRSTATLSTCHARLDSLPNCNSRCASPRSRQLRDHGLTTSTAKGAWRRCPASDRTTRCPGLPGQVS